MAQPLEFLSSFKCNHLLLRCDEYAGIPFPKSWEMDPHLEMRREKRLFLGCGGTFLIASRVSRTLSRLKKEGGVSLEMLHWKRASSSVEGRFSWFFSSCNRKLGVPLECNMNLRDPLV